MLLPNHRQGVLAACTMPCYGALSHHARPATQNNCNRSLLPRAHELSQAGSCSKCWCDRHASQSAGGASGGGANTLPPPELLPLSGVTDRPRRCSEAPWTMAAVRRMSCRGLRQCEWAVRSGRRPPRLGGMTRR